MIENRELQRLRVVVVGQGYVGLPLAVRAAEVGHRVVGLDVDVQRVKRLMLGESYVEDIPDNRLAPLLASAAMLRDLEVNGPPPIHDLVQGQGVGSAS